MPLRYIHNDYPESWLTNHKRRRYYVFSSHIHQYDQSGWPPTAAGNQFVENLESFLTSRGHSVCRTLEPGLDIILIVASRRTSATASYTDRQIARYLLRYPSAIVVHRVNNSDESHAQSIGINDMVMDVNRVADHTVFVSQYIRQLYLSHGYDESRPYSIILTGANPLVFNPDGRAGWQPGSPVKVVTHHWSSNYLKGFDIYERMDLLLQQPEMQGQVRIYHHW